MVICMNIGTDGERHIAYMLHSPDMDKSVYNGVIKLCKLEHDEVYVIDFKENEAFIDEVVLRGCRV